MHHFTYYILLNPKQRFKLNVLIQYKMMFAFCCIFYLSLHVQCPWIRNWKKGYWSELEKKDYNSFVSRFDLIYIYHFLLLKHGAFTIMYWLENEYSMDNLWKCKSWITRMLLSQFLTPKQQMKANKTQQLRPQYKNSAELVSVVLTLLSTPTGVSFTDSADTPTSVNWPYRAEL